jgi:methylated-DNA-protein-cysteine methyltransferase-like protein
MSFFSAVYEVARQIPRGKVATYGQIARLAGNPRMARQVGWALHANPEPLHPNEPAGSPGTPDNTPGIPCHRVLNRFGEVCKGFAFGGEEAQRLLLEAEGIKFGADGRVDLNIFGWEA